MKVLVAGGTGFIGRVLCRILSRRGHDVTAAGRAPPATIGEVETTTLDVTEPDLTGAVDGHDVVVNLVALPSHVEPTGQSHDAVTRQGTQHLVTASEATGVDRFIQMSALGVDSDVETAYFAAKRSAERIVRNSELDWVIYRPSVVFGDGCAFLPFLRKLSAARVLPLPGGGQMRIQPIWVDDLGEMLADGVEDATHTGETYELGGPDVLTLAETVVLLRPNTVVLPLPMALSAVGASVLEYLPGIPIGRDQHRVQTLDNTVSSNDVIAFDVDERTLHSLYEYLQT